jgi:phenylacetic acid degradation operon negative regulatory protein
VPRRTARRLDRLPAGRPPRAASLIVTLFGDAVLPHGDSIWLGSLIALAAPFGLNERLVRTAVLRLSRDDWLEARPVGRRSAYGVTAVGRQRVEDAYRRVYAAAPPRWDGSWCLVLVPPAALDRTARAALRRELGWLGFGALGPGALLHPSPDRASLDHVLRRLGLADTAIVIDGAATGRRTGTPLRGLVAGCWDLAEVEAGYRGFLERFRPVWSLLEAGAPRDPAACFRLRVLLIHEYRRAVLRDPLLPAELLPPDWPGNAARALARNIYRAVEADAERHLAPLLRNAEGPLPEPDRGYYQRFGGLGKAASARR